MRIWTEAAKAAILRHVAKTGSPVFTRQGLFAAELETIARETGTVGLTPGQTLGRELQELRDAGLLAFLDRGRYRWLGAMPELEPVPPGHAVFALAATSGDVPPESAYAFAPEWLRLVRGTVGEWIVYQDSSAYRAAARVDRIEADREPTGHWYARMVPGSFLDFGRPVPLVSHGVTIEPALSGPDGGLDARAASRRVRAITRDAFERILDLGLIADDAMLPRTDADEAESALSRVAEERSPWGEPVDRATMLVNRKVRNQQFRRRVLDAYGARCALTGMKLVNGGGRVETEAAHIKSVEAGGPDTITNGIALSGTVHWMFDRGLISLRDDGAILLSRAINDRDGVARLIHADGRARLPVRRADRPDPRYLAWHRTECFHD